eukprot:CAMPEP_0119297972 /NCGR_PEP_ID=MMETSP1333-20130426/174_1 /TAXON_ID=418940 /ORGANISM="Scyphosphaera apsteinii, Strain RCC1455" /LENGTH=516 /DNA_ID=CAMNT_0007298947 /DNA_START=107 /DNA_END=1657 /DNA_ORIENTATION=+
MRTITNWATGELISKLDGLHLCDGVQTQWSAGGQVSGEVSIGERKGKVYPIYSLEMELPWQGSVDNNSVAGNMHFPDISYDMLDDLEVEVHFADCILPDNAKSALESTGIEVVQTAVREWAKGLRKAVAENAADLPLDPPTQTQQPRAAALISEEEAMSASGAAALDDAQEDEENEIEHIPRPDGDEMDEGEEGEMEPFTEEEVESLMVQVRDALEQAFPGDEGKCQLQELDEELKDKDLQEQGRILVEVMDYLNNPDEAEGEGEARDGDAGGGKEEDETNLPYQGREALDELWKEVTEMCNEEDVPNLEEELKGKEPEEQWSILLDVRDYLINGDQEEQEAFSKWNPSLKELETEWRQLLKRVPKEEQEDVQEDWNKADKTEKKRLVWDVRKFIEQQDAEDAEAERLQKHDSAGPARAHVDDDDAVSKNEVRRRGARRGQEYEYNYEYDFAQQGGDWEDHYSKEAKRSRGGGRSFVLVMGVIVLVLVIGILLTATLLADDDEPVLQSALRLLRLS